eukprot:GILI01023783.1.p1 GENE.GILI01023783.1~~GILI01023783.1.p1  ORF type:complete len:343 (-),score=54.16 GILI01023783.1:142-1170(-)
MNSLQLLFLYVSFITLLFANGANALIANLNHNKWGGKDPSPNPQQTANPVIAMVASPMADCNYPAPDLQPPANFNATGCITDVYLRWLEAEGIRVVPMSAAWPDQQKKELLDQVNGVMFLGGGLTGSDLEGFVADVSYIFDYAVQNPGFFLWGTCQGFQVITLLLMDSDFSAMTCDYVGMYPSMLPLDFTPYQTNSVMLGLEAEKLGLVFDLETKNSTLNWHHCGITPDNFKPTAANARLISTNVDTVGKPFISAFEIVDGGMNIFAVQFHPERPQYQFTHDIITHDRATLDLSLYYSRLIYDRLQLNNHTFATQTEVNKLQLENFPHVVTGWGLGYYWINV